jgi:hypothetical protein
VNKRYLRFEINCFIKEKYIIYFIKNKLGFGTIRHLKFLDSSILEFSVQENYYDLLKLISIFNGNLRSVETEKAFLIFYLKLKVKLKKLGLLNLLPDYIKSIKPINLKDSWFLGYIDSGKVIFYAR